MGTAATLAIAKFIQRRSSLPFEEINFGSAGLHLYKAGEIESGQVGYAVARDGRSLCSGEEGAWRSGWIVIGYDTGSGDPLIIDANDPALPILRDFNGRGEWNPVKVAISLEAFLSQWAEFSRIASGRGTPVQLEANPLSEIERADFLARILALNNGRPASDFWEALLEG